MAADKKPRGRQWKKGESGNPRGISKKQAAARDRINDILSDAAPMALERIVELMHDPHSGTALGACKEVLVRFMGKPAEAPADDAGESRPTTIQLVVNEQTVRQVMAPNREDDEQPDSNRALPV